MRRETCPFCGGIGQRGYFKGESRFLLSWDECPACCGTGYHVETSESERDDSGETPTADVTSSGEAREKPAGAAQKTPEQDSGGSPSSRSESRPTKPEGQQRHER
jgi:hypothetical protein